MRRFLRRGVKPEKFMQKWQDLQKMLVQQESWPLAVITADKLLDEALKKKHLKGKSMGERLVAAQRQLTDNDAVWYAHNLSKKVRDTSGVKLRQNDVKKCLVGVRQALRDLGALRHE
jgi:hypothetical protein